MAALKDFNHVDLLFPSKFLKSADLRGKAVTVVIERIDPRGELKMRGGATETKPIVYLKGKEKMWVLNVTNARRIAEVWGPEVTKWIGRPVVIVSERVAFGGKQTDAVRVDVTATRRLANGEAVASAAEPDHNPDTGEVTEEEFNEAAAEQ